MGWVRLMRGRRMMALGLVLALACLGAATDVHQSFLPQPVRPKPASAFEAVNADDPPSPSPSPRAAARAVDAPLRPYVLQPSDGPFYAAPPMGWNGFNRYHKAVTETIVMAEAQALVASGMKDAGYRYVNLDGGWDLMTRSPDGSLVPDPRKFPHGITAVADYVHSLGLKFGIYTSAGNENCAGTTAGSYNHYTEDAATFASWDVDYVKLDWCYVPYAAYPRMSHPQVSRMLLSQFSGALKATGRRMWLDANDYMYAEQPWLWAHTAGASMWRVAADIQDSYPSLLFNFQHDVVLSWQASPGRWNDPDMLEVGNGGMTPANYRAMFSLWSELAAPLIAGNDLATMTPATREILTQRSVIAVDQDPLGVQGRAVASADGHWVLTKPLADGSRSVVLFNASGSSGRISTTLNEIGFRDLATYRVTDLWTGAASTTSAEISAEVPAGGAVMLRIW